MSKTATVCLYPDCSKEAAARGLCRNHYEACARLLRKSRAVESDLIERGLMLPKHIAQYDAVFLKDSTVRGDGVKGKGK